MSEWVSLVDTSQQFPTKNSTNVCCRLHGLDSALTGATWNKERKHINIEVPIQMLSERICVSTLYTKQNQFLIDYSIFSVKCAQAFSLSPLSSLCEPACVYMRV